MKLAEVLNILNSAGIEPESISYDGDEQTYKLDFMYVESDMVSTYFYFAIHLFDGGESSVDFLDSSDGWDLVPSEVIKLIMKVVVAWEGYWNEQIVQEEPHSEGLSE